MNVTLSIRSHIHPPLTRDLALSIASAYFLHQPVLVRGGNRTYLVHPYLRGKWVENGGLMTVSSSIQVTIPARETLTEYRAGVLAEDLAENDVVRVEGGRYTYLVVDEGGRVEVYPLGECRLCGRDTFGSGEYCGKCLSIGLTDDRYYSMGSCVTLVGELTEKLVASAEGGSMRAANELAELAGNLGIDEPEHVREYWKQRRGQWT